MKRIPLRYAAAPAAVVLAMSLAACGGNNEAEAGGGNGGGSVSGEVVADGSSTVEPLTAAAGELFAEESPDVNVSVGTSGTGGGFEKFCQGQTDISNASRPIKDEEIAICEENGIEYTELHVATDALTVVASAENDFVDCLTTEELEQAVGARAPRARSPPGTRSTRSSRRGPIELYGPGTDSGTFDYFTDEINGEEGASRSDYNASEDDNVIVQGVERLRERARLLRLHLLRGERRHAQGRRGRQRRRLRRPELPRPPRTAPTPRWRGRCSSTCQQGRTPTSRRSPSSSTSTSRSDADIAEAAQFIPLNDEQSAELEDAAASLG